MSMNERSLIATLKRIQREVENALAEFDDPDRPTVATCPWCKLPIREGDKINRGIHNACYKRAKKTVDAGVATWEQYEQEGRTVPSAKPGPKPLTDEEYRESRAAEERIRYNIKKKPKK